MGIAEKLKAVQTNLKHEVVLVAVSKTKSNADILQAYNSGQRIFGENKVQELMQKQEELLNKVNNKMDELVNGTQGAVDNVQKKVAELEKGEILVDVASDLADTEVEKFVQTIQGIAHRLRQ
mgnify:CR=1 FL=1